MCCAGFCLSDLRINWVYRERDATLHHFEKNEEVCLRKMVRVALAAGATLVNAGWRTLKFSKTVFPRSVAAGVRFCSIICVQKVPLSVRLVSCKRDFLHDEVEPEVENTKIPLMPFEANDFWRNSARQASRAVIKQCHTLQGKKQRQSTQ